MTTKMTLGFKRGVKVVPKSKSVWCSLEQSGAWAAARAKEQPYLYVIKEDTPVDADSHCLVCSETADEENGGDFFLPSDVEIYEEPKTNANEI